LVDTMQTFSGDLDRMASGQQPSSGLATDLVRQAAERTRQLCERLEGREPAQLLDDVRDFARRRPGTFLLGSLAAGVVAGRLLRGAKDSSGSATSASSYDRTSLESDVAPSSPAYDATTAAATTGEAPTGPITTTEPTTETASETAAVGTGQWTAPQPVTGPLEVDESGQGTYRDSGTGSR
jgi:hypothetical protein